MPLVTDQCPMGDAIVEMSTKSFGCSGVIDNQGNLLGMITDGDLRRWLGDNGALDTKAAGCNECEYPNHLTEYFG